jgi:hypothetical protein
MKFADFQTSDRRLTILLALDNAAEYKANHFLLNRYCASVGHSVSMDSTQTDLAWLAEQGLVTLEKTPTVQVATITQRGIDVANARAVVPGVARPAPGQD